jgi:CheY-like chemotaxis protein
MRRARILVVDDQAYVRDFLSEELGQDGYVVKSFVGLDRLKHEIAAILEKGSACSPDGCLERLH